MMPIVSMLSPTLTVVTTRMKATILATLAVVWTVTHFIHDLYGKRFTLITDQLPLEWLLTSNKLVGKK